MRYRLHFLLDARAVYAQKKYARVQWDSKISRQSAEDSLAHKLVEKIVPPHAGRVLVCIGDWRATPGQCNGRNWKPINEGLAIHHAWKKHATPQFDIKWVDEYMTSRAFAKCHKRMPLPKKRVVQNQEPPIGGHHQPQHMHRFQVSGFADFFQNTSFWEMLYKIKIIGISSFSILYSFSPSTSILG